MGQINNIITVAGHCEPFVYADEDGVTHVGDRDNHETFATLIEARRWASAFRLAGDELNQLLAEMRTRPSDVLASEYAWHYDSELMLDALDTLEAQAA